MGTIVNNLLSKREKFLMTIVDFLAAEHGVERLRALDAAGGQDDALWPMFVEMGLPGLLVPEAHGGLGLDLVTGALVGVELGRAGVSGPIADTEGMRRLAPSPEALAKAVASVPLQRMGTLQDVAHMALFLASPQAGYVTGAVIPVDGGAALGGGRDMRASYQPRGA